MTNVTPTVIGAAVIGCGWAGQRHAAALAGQGASLRWAVDIDPSRARAVAEAFPPCRMATSYEQALSDASVDVVSLCLPHDLHAPVGIAALEAGKHVLVEKPLAADLDEADAMIAAAERANRILMVAENVRFAPLYLRVQALLDDGAIGRPSLIQMTRECYLRRSFLEDRPWFLNERQAAGGIMMSGGIHDFETMRMLLGEIEQVQALRAPQRFLEMEGDDTSVALVRFAGADGRPGAVGTLVESFLMKNLITASGPEVHTLRIDGELGSIEARDGRTIHLFSERADLLPGGELREHTIHVPEEDTFTALIAHLLACIAHGSEPVTSGRRQRRALEAVCAAYRSMAEGGGPVTLSGPPG
jgi:predicted dehydrogenase